MAEIVIMGAGLGGAVMAYEMKDQMRPQDKLTVVTKDPIYHFVPSNPWVAVGWRSRQAVEVDLAPTLAKRGITFKPVPVVKVFPNENRLELADGSAIRYDYLVIATGPELAFDEIEGLGPDANTSSICHIDHALKAGVSFEEFCKNPGPIVTGAVQGASCFGPAYEFTFILETELRRRRIRDRVPMTFVTAEPYIGHLGLDGVGDTKGLLESEMREHHIKWITSARVKKVEPGKMTIEEVADDGSVKATRELPFAYSMMLPAFRGIAPLRGDRRPRQSARLRRRRQAPAEPEISECLRRRRVRRDCAGRTDAGAMRRAEDGLHDRVDGHRDRAQHRPDAARREADPPGDLERRLPRRLRRFRRRLRRPAANPAAQRQLVVVGPVGARGQAGFREVFPAQDAQRRERALLRVGSVEDARHRQAEDGDDRLIAAGAARGHGPAPSLGAQNISWTAASMVRIFSFARR